MPSLGIAPHPEGCTGPFTMPAPGVTSASGAMPTDGSLRRLEIGVQAVQLSPYHTGPADASVPAPGPDRRFSGMRLSRSPFGSGLAIGPKNLPSSSSRLRRGYDKAPRGAIQVELIHVHGLAREGKTHARLVGLLVAFEAGGFLLGFSSEAGALLRSHSVPLLPAAEVDDRDMVLVGEGINGVDEAFEQRSEQG